MQFFRLYIDLDIDSLPKDILNTTIHFSGMEATFIDWITDAQQAWTDGDMPAFHVFYNLNNKHTNQLIAHLFNRAMRNIKLPRNELLTAGQLRDAIQSSDDPVMELARLLYAVLNSGYEFSGFSDRFNRFLKRAVDDGILEYHPQTTTYQANSQIPGRTVTKTRVKNLYKLL